MTERDRALRSAVAAARRAGGVLVRGFRSPDKRAHAKAHPNDPTTAYDRAAEEAIVRVLRAEHPDDGLEKEESAASGGISGRRWIIDPLDGTNNFVAGIPHFAVSIALEHGGEVLLGCVHDPVRDETFTAVRGEGSRVNGERIGVSTRDRLDGAVLGAGLASHPGRRAEMVDQLPLLVARAGVLRTLGSASLDLAYVAAGRFDAIWYLSLHAWDVAGGGLLVEEAGGRVTDLRGAPLRDPLSGVAASNGRLHAEFLHALG